MREYSHEIVLLTAFILLIAGSMGCATMFTMEAIKKENRPNKSLALTDEIVAIGRPDAALAQELGQRNVVAFLGVKNTYMLFKGGAELEWIVRSGLNPERIKLDATQSRNLFIKDKQVWGHLRLTYGDRTGISFPEQQILGRQGFSATGGQFYQRKVYIEGLLYPPIKLSAEQDSLKIRRAIHLYKTSSKPSKNYAAAALLPLAIATDVILTPVYLGVGIVLLTKSMK
ncbi:MAG: hypothetical protein GY862_38995 [Gammaproteobacteria bacterium]|nr:hypothetical protein [Gammaproteobacteria bacterium]